MNCHVEAMAFTWILEMPKYICSPLARKAQVFTSKVKVVHRVQR